MTPPRPGHEELPAETPTGVCRRYEPRPAVRELLADDPPLVRFTDRLLANEDLLADAVDFLAHALPRRAAIWWGCLCVEMTAGSRLPSAEEEALAAAVRWVFDPTEPNRRAAWEPSEAAGPMTAAGNLARAVYVSAVSLLPPGLTPAAPPDEWSARYVTAAIHTACTAVRLASEVPRAYRQSAALAVGLGRGKHLWSDREPGSREG